MRILYLASVRIPNEKASGLAIMRQCEAFAQIGHTVTLVRPYRKNHIQEDSFTYYGMEKLFGIVTIHSIDLVDWCGSVGFYITRLSQILTSFFLLYKRKNLVDVIYARDPWMLILPLIFFRNKKKIIWEAHQIQRGFAVRFVAQQAHVLVCISSGLSKYYSMMRGEKRTIIEPSGVHMKQFQNLPSVPEVRKALNLPIDKKIIAYIGKYKTMGEEKGVDELIHAFAGVYKNNTHTHLMVVGLEEREVEEVREKCTVLGLSACCYTLLPLVQKDFALYVQAADILVMNYPDTEHYRTVMSPTKLFAYMASKKTIVASDLPSIREIVTEEMVFFVAPNDQMSLTDVLEDVCKNEDCLFAKQEIAFEKVKEFEWKIRATRITVCL